MLDKKLRKHLKDINTKLTAIEKHMVQTAIWLDKNLQKELAKGMDGIVDYELNFLKKIWMGTHCVNFAKG